MMMMRIAPLDLNAKYVNAEIVTKYETVKEPHYYATGSGVAKRYNTRYRGNSNILYDCIMQLDTDLYILHNSINFKFEHNIDNIVYSYRGNLYFLKKRD